MEFAPEDCITTFECCLAQSGNPIALSAVGGGRVVLDFADTAIQDVLKLVPHKEQPLYIAVFCNPGGDLIQRRGRPKNKE